jgi:hypothetical protein
MIRKGFFLLFIVAVCHGVASGQKVKYKDLLVLLNAKQYEQAKPFLKKYLTEEDDNPSAYLFMGIIYQEEALKDDVLKQSDLLVTHVDSAVFFYNKCLPKLTDKEIKKNDENYQMYTRRDLRTGEFGIKLSDIQLDLETRTKSLYERRDRVMALKKYFQEMEGQYNRANAQFKNLQSRYNTRNDLFLQSDDNLILELEKLSATFDSSQISFKNYKSTLQALGKTGYNPVVDLVEIKDMKKEGTSPADFMADDLKFWNYGDWARKSSALIRDEVYAVRKEIIAFDSEINKLRDKIKKDSVTIPTDELKRHPVFEELKKWDTDPMPAALFRMKIAELAYSSELVEEASLKGESNISKKISLIKDQQLLLMSLDSLATVMVNRDWENDAVNYKNFITSAYGTVAVVKNLTKSTLDFARRESVVKKKELEENLSLLKWVISDTDSIPLFKDVPEESLFKPLVIADTHTAGVKQLDTLMVGYFYTVTPSRTADLKVSFPVDSVSISKRDLPLVKGLSLAVSDQLYYILFYSESKIDGKIPITLAKISRVAGLEWSSVFKTELTPVELKFANSSGELSIKTSSPDGNSKMVVLDKTGGRIQ